LVGFEGPARFRLNSGATPLTTVVGSTRQSTEGPPPASGADARTDPRVRGRRHGSRMTGWQNLCSPQRAGCPVSKVRVPDVMRGLDPMLSGMASTVGPSRATPSPLIVMRGPCPRALDPRIHPRVHGSDRAPAHSWIAGSSPGDDNLVERKAGQATSDHRRK
jgi:hypothetical protein